MTLSVPNAYWPSNLSLSEGKQSATMPRGIFTKEGNMINLIIHGLLQCADK